MSDHEVKHLPRTVERSPTFIWGRQGEECPYLSDLTTLEVGGQPKYYACVTHEHEAREVSRWAQDQSLPLWVVGGGSNVVCDDDQLDGVVLQLALKELTIH